MSVVIKRDMCKYRVGAPGAWRPSESFDPHNPPTIQVGEWLMFIPQLWNEQAVDHIFRYEVTVSGPARTITPAFILDPLTWRPIPAGGGAGYGFYFGADVAGDYQAIIRVHQDAWGNVTDEWTVKICSAQVKPGGKLYPPPRFWNEQAKRYQDTPPIVDPRTTIGICAYAYNDTAVPQTYYLQGMTNAGPFTTSVQTALPGYAVHWTATWEAPSEPGDVECTVLLYSHPGGELLDKWSGIVAIVKVEVKYVFSIGEPVITRI